MRSRSCIFSKRNCITADCGIITHATFFSPGKPLPRVLWYLDDALLDDTFQQTYDSTVKNSLTVRDLGRKHTRGRLRCVATNNNITKPAETEVKLKMLCE